MNNWEKVKLTQICEPKQWKTIPINKLTDSGYPVYGANGKIGYYSEYNHEKPTILITCRGATCGEINICEPYSYVTGNAMALDNIKDDRVDLKFLYYALRHSELGSAISGSAQPQITRLGLEYISISIPSLEEQRHIAAILDKADNIRRKRQEARRLTEEFMRSAFLEIVGPGALEYEKWPEGTIEGLALDKKNSMRTGPFGSDLRHSEFIDKGIAVLGIDNAVKNYFEWGERRFITPEKYEKLKRYKIFPGDVIITIMGTTGRSAVIPDDIPLAITTKHLAAITLNRKLAHPEFIAYAIHDHPEILHQIEKAQRGAIMNGLNLTLIKELRFSVPPLPIQEHFASIVHKIRQTLNKLSKANEYGAGDLFNSLVQRAFRGELATTEDELAQQEGRPYESASVPLSKIKALGKDL